MANNWWIGFEISNNGSELLFNAFEKTEWIDWKI